MSRKRYWPDGAAQRAKCPKCGQLGTRTLICVKHNKPRCWQFQHSSVPSKIIPGVNEAVICFVPVETT